MGKMKLLTEVAPGRPGTADSPEVGPTYRAHYAPGGLAESTSTCYELFKCVSLRLPAGWVACVGQHRVTCTGVTCTRCYTRSAVS